MVDGRKYEYHLELNKDAVRRYWDGKWNKREPDILDELQTPDVAYHSPTLNINGIEEYKQAYSSYRAALQDTEIMIEDIMAEGDKVMTRTRLNGIHGGELEGMPATGKRFSFISYTIFRLVHGKIAEEWELLDEYSFMRQLGVIK